MYFDEIIKFCAFIDGTASRELLQVNVSLSSIQLNSTCERILRLYNNGLTQRELCAIVDAGSNNSCFGDQWGSPVVCNGVLAGILFNQTDCSAGSVYKFTDVTRSLNWLRNAHMNDTHYELVFNESEINFTTNKLPRICTTEKIEMTEKTEKTEKTSYSPELPITSQNKTFIVISVILCTIIVVVFIVVVFIRKLYFKFGKKPDAIINARVNFAYKLFENEDNALSPQEESSV